MSFFLSSCCIVIDCHFSYSDLNSQTSPKERKTSHRRIDPRRRNHRRMDNTLPEGCWAEILSRTSPLDASRLAAISREVNAGSKSDIVWGGFLPSDYSQIVARSISPVVYATKRELYFSLCRSPILLDGGNLSFFLDQRTGKKCFMLGARELEISWGDIPLYWEWTPHADSRFSEVARLKTVCWLDIRGRTTTQMLSPSTTYGAYLVFKLAEGCYGLELANAVVRFVDSEADNDAEERAIAVHLQQAEARNRARRRTRQVLVERVDGWREIELGDFYNDEGYDGDVEARLIEIKSLHSKSGLIVEGIEFRPKTQFGST
ncbi:hypothetical protein CDL12_15382 [Handroanthus impetiginosus]|uniref:F-box domain-containing protein n=1 Tax=Handroanthus impetiginosus TaxID=429701 RepID=A0A2G9H3A2_9LAMI|nr:hypothetical protein CDL12_15382 [Handroanthus impetiginosus]